MGKGRRTAEIQGQFGLHSNTLLQPKDPNKSMKKFVCFDLQVSRFQSRKQEKQGWIWGSRFSLQEHTTGGLSFVGPPCEKFQHFPSLDLQHMGLWIPDPNDSGVQVGDTEVVF